MTLEGKVVLITGGASGIGAGVARRLAAAGARVVIVDVDTEGGAAVAAGVDGLFADVGRLGDNARAVRTAVECFGRVDIAMLNAGVGGAGNLVTDLDAESYRRLRTVNLDAVVYGIHALRGQLNAQGGGAIIVTSSLAGLHESPLDPLYAATKHAVLGLVRSLAPVLAAEGVTINALCPTCVDTPLLADVLPHLVAAGVAVLDVEQVADVAERILADGGSGQAWPVLPHDEAAPFAFPSAPNVMASLPDDTEVAP